MATPKKQQRELAPHMVVSYSDECLAREITKLVPDVEDMRGSVVDLPNYTVNSTDWLLKEAEKLVEMAIAKKDSETTQNSIFIKANDQIINLKLSDVLWIEAYGDYVNFITEKTKYLVHSTMKAIENKLPIGQFTRVHRSFIIRQDKIDLIEESLIQIGKKLIPIGESYHKDFMSRLNLL